jgi:hypothetical protein
LQWIKQGLLYVANGHQPWSQTHAMIPTPELIDDKILRFYITVCDQGGVGRISCIDVNPSNPKEVLAIANSPILDIGQPGTFDENGVLVTSVVTLADGRKFLYYVGFELGTKIRYRLLSGLAISEDNGKKFIRLQKTPILERSDRELYFRGGPFVLWENGVFRMWYVAGDQWLNIKGKEMPVYTINYLESIDGIHWDKEGKVCIDIANQYEHGFGRPYVIKHNNKYKMFYSIRINELGYRLGYAESNDGIDWIRKDKLIGIDVSESGWDSNTICYSAVMNLQEQYYMFYNGNAFGETGFGWAKLVSW